MREQNSVDTMLDAIAEVLIRCFAIGLVFMIIWGYYGHGGAGLGMANARQVI